MKNPHRDTGLGPVLTTFDNQSAPLADEPSTGRTPVSRQRTHIIEGEKKGPRPLFLLCFVFVFLTFAFPRPVQAIATQEDVFKSIQSNESDSIDGRKMIAVLAAVAGVVIVVLLINNRQERQELPQTLNHSGKLLRELMKSAGLKSAQIRQLKMLSADLADKGQPVDHLVTLLLCPSLIKKARDRKGK